MSASPLFKKPAKSRGNIRQRGAADEDVGGIVGSSSSPLARTSTTAEDVTATEARATSIGRTSSRVIEVDEEEDEGSLGMSPMLLAKQRKKDKDKRKLGSSTSGGKSAARLSFGVSEEGDEDSSGSSSYESPSSKAFVPRKSTLSQSVSLQKLALGGSSSAGPSSPLVSSYGRASSTSYLDKYGSTPTRPSSTSVTYASGNGAGDHDEGEAMLLDEDDSFRDPGPSSRHGISQTARSKYGYSNIEEPDSTEGIPDEARIAAAKLARRKALVGGGGSGTGAGGGGGGDVRDSITEQEDYVQLGDGRVKVYDEDENGLRGRRDDGPHPESRLQREDDEEGEGDEDLADYTEANTTINLTTKANKAAARRLKTEMLEAIDDREGEDLDDEDAREWESAQARAGGGGVTLDRDDGLRRVAKKAYIPARAPASRPMPTISGASNRLQASLGLLEASTKQRTAHLTNVERELSNLDTQEEELRQEVERVEAKKEWMEEFRGWVETLGGFMEEKFPILETIEKDALRHYSERRGIVSKRRREDDLDDLALFLGVAPVAANGEEEEEVDEMGRTRRRIDVSGPHSGVRRARREERQARRDRRRAKQPQQAQEDGFSTDSELGEADAEDYHSAQNALMTRVKALSSDVTAEDFRDPVLGLAARFGGWRKNYEEEYTNAYGGLAMVQAWEYWARSEMANWEPSRSTASLDSFRWYHALHEYSRPSLPSGDVDMDLDDDEPPLGPDGDLVPAMVSSAVTGLMTKYVEAGGYDLYSARQTRRLVDLVDMVGEYVGKENSKYRAILRSILLAFNEHIDELSTAVVDIVLDVTATPPPAFDPATRTSLLSFGRRRIKLIRDLRAWKRYIPFGDINTLIGKLVAGALRPALQKCWDSGGSEVAAQILAIAPDGSLSDDLKYFLSSGPITSSSQFRTQR